jgi:flagellar L-ring protein precursor FlgH
VTRVLCLLALAALLDGCAAPRVDVHQPSTARASAQGAGAAPPADGAIYRPASYRPLFEDRRARRVGDTLTVVINEKISAAQKNATAVNRSGSVAFAVPTATVPALNGNLGRLAGTELEGSSAVKSDGKGESSASNAFTGTITVTVIEVLPNGNLLVAGTKEIGTNRELERLRFSGVVNPVSVLPGNQVSSTQVADARLDYRGEGASGAAQVTGWLSQFFLSVLPF